MDKKLDSRTRRDAPQQMDRHLSDIRAMAADIRTWDFVLQVEQMGPDRDHVHYSILFKPAVWPRVEKVIHIEDTMHLRKFSH